MPSDKLIMAHQKEYKRVPLDMGIKGVSLKELQDEVSLRCRFKTGMKTSVLRTLKDLSFRKDIERKKGHF